MKYSLFVLLFFISTLIYSQATPQWLFPIWFEDANGDRDTVYIGYDPEANNPSGFDPEFEKYISIDTTVFGVLVNRDITYSPNTGNWNADSGKIIEIDSDSYPSANLTFLKGQMPITMYWDMSLFYSNDLPYPYLSPYPNAAGFVYCGAGEPGYVNCPSAFDDDPLSLVDSVNINYEFPITSPHVFEGSGVPPFNEPEEVLSSFYIIVQPYQLITSIENNPSNTTFYPNPFSDYLFIKSRENIASIKLMNSAGELVIAETDVRLNDVTLFTSNLPGGLYFLQVELMTYSFSSIIIKQ